MKITIVNAETDLGVNIAGTELGPKNISNHYINHDKINILSITKENIQKSQNIHDKRKNLDAVNKFNEKLYEEVVKIEDDNQFPIILGGDHSLSIATSLASIKKYKKLGIIWIDSHGDYNTFETTTTGNIHGLPLATVNHKMDEQLSPFHKGNYFLPENTVIVGGRDIDPLEMPNILRAGVTLFTTDDIKRLGIQEVIRQAMKIALKDTEGVHISYDLDVIDPNIAPGVSVKAENGITEKEAYEITKEILKYKEKMKSFDLVELNPLFDVDKKTEEIAVHILKEIIDEVL